MKLQLATTAWKEAAGDWLIVPLCEGFEISGPIAALDQALSGHISRLRESQDLTGKLAELVTIPGPAGIKASRLVLIGLGLAEKIDNAGLNRALMTAVRAVSGKKSGRVALAL